jgi:molybdate transport system substrate-binding protein
MTTSLMRGKGSALIFAAVFAVASVFFVACGDDDDGGATGTAPTAAAATAKTAPATGATGATGAAATATPAAETVSGTVIVFAAASLTDAFTEIGEAFEAANPEASVEFNFQGSSALRTQIEEGAPSDVFASANIPHMDTLEEADLAGDSEIFVHNSLVIITPSDNPAGVESLADLQNNGLKLVLAAPEVPVGGYAREMFEKANAVPEYGTGFSAAVEGNVVSNESNVKQVVTKVQLGEADAGVVYGSDVTPDVAPELETIQVPDDLNVIADYPIATLTDSENAEGAEAFVAFVQSDEGQEILAKWGFAAV